MVSPIPRVQLQPSDVINLFDEPLGSMEYTLQQGGATYHYKRADWYATSQAPLKQYFFDIDINRLRIVIRTRGDKVERTLCLLEKEEDPTTTMSISLFHKIANVFKIAIGMLLCIIPSMRKQITIWAQEIKSGEKTIQVKTRTYCNLASSLYKYREFNTDPDFLNLYIYHQDTEKGCFTLYEDQVLRKLQLIQMLAATLLGCPFRFNSQDKDLTEADIWNMLQKT